MSKVRFSLVAALSLAVVSPGFADEAAPASTSPAQASPAAATSAPAAPAPPTSALGAPLFDSGKLLATGGVSQLEGAGGGGLASWALITGYGTEDAVGTSAHYTYIYLPNYTIHALGAGVGLFDRVELTYSRLFFDTRSTGSSLGLGKDFTIHEDVVGAKVKLIGDAVYDQNSWMPQIAAGIEYKMNNRGALVRALGAKSADGTDFYLAATKLFLSQSLLVSGALRETKANQFGILGFGGDKNNNYTTQFEGSVALQLSRNWVVGVEGRTKPDNLRFAREDDSGDAFIAYFFNKHLSVTLAFVALGDIATKRDQNGVYLSLQTGF